MALVNHSVTNLINGVSEQAPAVRLDNQLEEQINCFSDVTRGLTKRNGLELKQITQLDIEDRFKIAFTIDGIKHMVALDANDGVTPLKYVPLSTDVDSLAVAINESQYFKEMSRGDLQIIEDKERVYLLNRRQIVGGASSRATYFDIKLIRQDNFTTPTTWDAGEYTITIDGVADPDHVPLQVAVGQVVVTVDRAKTLQQIADEINAVTALTDETGPCTVSGTISNYRISFNSIPTGYIYPTVVTLETTDVTEGQDVTIDSGWLLISGNTVVQQQPDGSYHWRFNNSLVHTESSLSSIVVQGIYTYYSQSPKSGVNGSGDFHKIKRTYVSSTQLEYEVETTSPSLVTSGQSGIDFPNKAMIWVTGVSSNQTYDTTITYYDVNTPMTLLTATSSTSVGTTASNIKLNYVATDIKNDYDGHADFSAVVYDNAVLVTAVAGFGIEKVEVTNNYDITSISGVTEAVEGNTEGIKDISTLPPSFADDFKVRVSVSDNDRSNFYMTYSSAFKGWKEAGLDESRFIDFTTMPYIIDKTKTKESGIITIEPSSWAQALAGDEQSNVDPSFVGRTINDMFFYGSRLGFATDDTLVMSEIGEHDTFYRTTASQSKTSDRVDIKLDSSKIGYDPIKHVITYDGKLFLNTGSNQSVLFVNNAFELTSARLSEVSSYSLGDNKPMPVGSGLYFANTTDNVTNIFNYVPSQSSKYEAIEMTKHCPRYVQGAFKSMAYSSDLAVIQTFADKKVLFVQNRYSQGVQMLQNSWHKWVLPFDVEHFYFEDNVLFVIMSSFDSGGVDKYTIVTKYSLKPQDVEDVSDEIYIGWTPFIDCYTKDKTLIENFSEFQGVNDQLGVSYSTVSEAYDSTYVEQFDEGTIDGPYFDKDVGPLYYWKLDGHLNTVVFNDGTPITFGNTNVTSFDSGGYRYYKGTVDDGTGHFEVSRAAITDTSFHTDDMLYGVPFTSELIFSEIVPRQQTQEGFKAMNFATLMLRRIRLLLNKSGLFDIIVDFRDRKDYVTKYTGLPLGEFVIGRGTVSNINFNFPVNAKSDRVEIKLQTKDSTPFNLLSIEWQGQLINKGRNI